jgi:hypothetical protein
VPPTKCELRTYSHRGTQQTAKQNGIPDGVNRAHRTYSTLRKKVADKKFGKHLFNKSKKFAEDRAKWQEVGEAYLQQCTIVG